MITMATPAPKLKQPPTELATRVPASLSSTQTNWRDRPLAEVTRAAAKGDEGAAAALAGIGFPGMRKVGTLAGSDDRTGETVSFHAFVRDDAQTPALIGRSALKGPATDDVQV